MPDHSVRALAAHPGDPGPLPEGIRRIALPTPLPVGRVNAYLIEGSPLTLFDCGINTGTCLDDLEQALAALGHRIEDIELLVLTHQHVDHVGLAPVIARRARCPIAAYALLEPVFRSSDDGVDTYGLVQEWSGTQLLRHGYAEEVMIGARVGGYLVQALGSRPQIDVLLSPGDIIRAGDRDWEVRHRPGHSPSDLIFVDAERGVAIAGDHLLASTSPNPTLSPPLEVVRPDATTDRLRSLPLYLESLRQTAADDLKAMLPGHGEWLGEPGELIESRLVFHAKRADRIHGLLTDEPQSVFQIASQLWRGVPVIQPFLTCSEVIGHLDILTDEGRASGAPVGDGIEGFVAN